MPDRVEKTKKTGGFDRIHVEAIGFFMSYCVNSNTVYAGFIKAMGKVMD